MTEYIPRTGVQILPEAVEKYYLPAMKYGSMVGVLSENIDLVPKLLGTEGVAQVFYMAHNGNQGNGGWDLWFSTLSKMAPEDAVAVWWEKAGRGSLGLELKDLLYEAGRNDRRLVVGGFGEIPQVVLNNPVELRKFALFEKARAERLWAQDGRASIGKFSTGTLTKERVEAFLPALPVCRWNGEQEPIAVFCIDEYAAIWPTTWMGQNQTDILPPDATREQKYEALLKDPHPDFSNPEKWRPAYLMGRVWGDNVRNADGETLQWGYPDLWDCLMMLGEFGVDTILHDDIPLRGNGEPFNGWYTCRSVWKERLGYADEQDGLRACLELGDDFYARLRLPNGNLQVPWRMWFGCGPGHGWEEYDIARTGASGKMYLDYLKEKPPLPPALELVPLNDPPDDIPPDVEPPDDEEPPDDNPPTPDALERLQGVLLDPEFWGYLVKAGQNLSRAGGMFLSALFGIEYEMLEQVVKGALND